MKTLPQLSIFIWVGLFLLTSPFSSCNKQEELHAFKGRVINSNDEPVSNATVELFKNSDDWLTGQNAVAKINSDFDGYFESGQSYEAGKYFILIEKYDSSNWEIRSVENGIFPTVSLPNDGSNHLIEYTGISLLSNTNWLITNRHQEFSKPGQSAKEWRSIWSSVNNCVKDNRLFFYRDLTMKVSEGKTVCNGELENIEGKFVPPLIFNILGCDRLPNTSVLVKEFEISGWSKMNNIGAQIFLACDQSMGQLYIYYPNESGKMFLDVYTRQN